MAIGVRVAACVACVCTWAACARGEDVVVNTRYGALRGSRTDTGPQSHVDVFYNIPYAKPPVGQSILWMFCLFLRHLFEK